MGRETLPSRQPRTAQSLSFFLMVIRHFAWFVINRRGVKSSFVVDLASILTCKTKNTWSKIQKTWSTFSSTTICPNPRVQRHVLTVCQLISLKLRTSPLSVSLILVSLRSPFPQVGLFDSTTILKSEVQLKRNFCHKYFVRLLEILQRS